jgi:hypothetical protein
MRCARLSFYFPVLHMELQSPCSGTGALLQGRVAPANDDCLGKMDMTLKPTTEQN